MSRRRVSRWSGEESLGRETSAIEDERHRRSNIRDLGDLREAVKNWTRIERIRGIKGMTRVIERKWQQTNEQSR